MLSYLVGYVDHLDMYSMDFEEFLWANGVKEFSISFQVKESSENLVGSNLEKETNSLHDVIKVGKDISCVITFQ